MITIEFADNSIILKAMNHKTKDDSFCAELQLIHHLLLRSSFSKDFGLFHGKMGVILFFYHYAKHINNAVYEDFAGELLDDIWEQLHKKVPNNFASGLSGIAWGIEYLIQNDFVAGNSNEICEEIDCKIMSSDIRRINSEFIETELDGFLHYVLIRTSGSVKQTKKLPFNYTTVQTISSVFF
jgi:lantibiotic modifying enzyme